MIFIIWGEDKSCKTTLALSFPRPLVHMELDIGGFDRANRNLPHLPIKDWVKDGSIIHEEFILPFQISRPDPVQAARANKILVGMKELFYEMVDKYIKHLRDPKIATIVLDTGTMFYNLVCDAYVQEKQELQLPLRPDGMGRDGKPLRIQLQQHEYREPYSRMAGIIYQAKAHKKNLVITHHATDEYGMVQLGGGVLGQGMTGKRQLHGWKKLGTTCDVMGKTYWDDKVPVMDDKGTLTGYTGKPFFDVELGEIQELRGMKFEEPTYDKINQVIKMIRGEE